MGFNICVIATDKNEGQNFASFADSLGYKVERAEFVDFSEASESWKQDFIDVLFLDNATLLFVPMNEYPVQALSLNRKIATSVVGEMSDVFNLEVYENGSPLRIFTTSEGVVHRNFETPLACEKEEDYMDRMTSLIEDFIDQPFWDLEKQENFVRFKIIESSLS